MDKKIMKETLEDNTEKKSLANSVIVRWKWDYEKKYRDFLAIRLGGEAESEYDLQLKYRDEALENESVLILSDQLAHISKAEQKQKILSLLSGENWQWNPEQEINLSKEVQNLLK